MGLQSQSQSPSLRLLQRADVGVRDMGFADPKSYAVHRELQDAQQLSLIGD